MVVPAAAAGCVRVIWMPGETTPSSVGVAWTISSDTPASASAFCAGAKPDSGTVVPATTNWPSRTPTGVSPTFSARNSIDEERCGSPPGARITLALAVNPASDTGPTLRTSAEPVASEVMPAAPWTTLAVDRAPPGPSSAGPNLASDDADDGVALRLHRQARNVVVVLRGGGVGAGHVEGVVAGELVPGGDGEEAGAGDGQFAGVGHRGEPPVALHVAHRRLGGGAAGVDEVLHHQEPGGAGGDADPVGAGHAGVGGAAVGRGGGRKAAIGNPRAAVATPARYSIRRLGPNVTRGMGPPPAQWSAVPKTYGSGRRYNIRCLSRCQRPITRCTNRCRRPRVSPPTQPSSPEIR